MGTHLTDGQTEVRRWASSPVCSAPSPCCLVYSLCSSGFVQIHHEGKVLEAHREHECRKRNSRELLLPLATFCIAWLS